MATEFKPGDFVELKSGGPKMTVGDVKKGITGNVYLCFYSDGRTVHKEEFPVAVLMEFTEPIVVEGGGDIPF